ncbi:sulfate/molybdate ABC transporter ATP-binding protein, partial [Clostridium tyrobutyricum]
MGLYVDIEKKFPEFNLKVKFESKDGVLGLLGASGSGKSMTLKCIAGLETPDRGKIVLNEKIFYDSGKNINIPIKKRKVGFLFQDYALFPNMTVNQNIGFALDNISKSEKGEIVREKINMMNLTGLSERFPSQLSGGQQQRVAIARALAINPEILLLDEPFSALDSHLRSKMEKEIVGILSTYSGSAVFVSHNRDEIYRICKNIAVIDNGVVDA